MGPAARLYEPVIGRMLAGVRRAGWELGPVGPGALVVDVGCGTGAFLAAYASAGCRVAGVDASAAMLAEARRRLGPGALLVQGEAAALPFSTGAAELVVAMMLLHSLSAAEGRRVLAEMARVAGAAGRVLVADHRPGVGPGVGSGAARLAARLVETIAGHGAGVGALRAAGGVAALASAVGLEVDARRFAAGGALEVVRLRCAGTVA